MPKLTSKISLYWITKKTVQCSTHVKAENEEKQGLVTLVVCLGQSGLEAAVALQLGHQCELSQLQ